ncbi:MAG: hypothetical protein E2P06_07965 [Acidobacteria bacterium]|nr:MAG: hypothetical protein E2P06_07965 [Acidobacteriota bacterium]
MLEVVAVLRRHVPDDTYRFEPATDFTGRNVYRSSLLRLESLETIHTDTLRAGHMEGVIAFAKGRSLERLRAFELAAQEYQLAAELDPELAVEAGRSRDVCVELAKITELGVGLDELAASVAIDIDADAMSDRYDERARRLAELARLTESTHHSYIVREEIERTDVAKAQYFVATRQILPNGDVRAAAELQRVVIQNKDSKHSNHHILDLADLYEELAFEYLDAYPPESLEFDPARFQELVEATTRLYELVAGQDGKPERLEASRRLEAFLAFVLRVDRDRFTR